jgi:hypothetical protein
MSEIIERPNNDEYDPFYAGYIRRAGESGILDTLARQSTELEHALEGLSEQQALFRPAPGEWSIKEVLGHLCDAERIFFYRALCISRGEQALLPGFEQDDYVREAGFDAHGLNELLQEFRLIRQANLLSLKHLSSAASLRRGNANGKPISTRALVYILAGHVYHHLESIQTVYLPAL